MEGPASQVQHPEAASAAEQEKCKWDARYAAAGPAPESEALRRFSAEFVSLVRELLPEGGRILEAGCGGGSHSAALARLDGYETHLMDFSDSALALARRRFDQTGLTAKFVLGDLFEPGRPEYDLVFNRGVLEHYDPPDQVRLLRGMASRSRRYVLVMVPNRQCYWYWLWRIRQAGLGNWPYGKEVPAADLQGLFDQAGLHFLGQAFIAEAWTEDFIRSLTEINDGLRQQILEIHRQPLIPSVHKAYLLAALGSTVEPPAKLPVRWIRIQGASDGLAERWAAALADSLAQQLQLKREIADHQRGLEAARGQVETLQASVLRKDAMLARLRSRYREKARAAAELLGLCEGRNEVIRQLSSELEERRSQQSLLQTEVESLRRQAAELRDQVSTLKEQLALREKELTAARQEASRAADELKTLQQTASLIRLSQQHEAELAGLRQTRQELERKLRFANERIRELSTQLQQLWDSPTWQLLNRLHNSRIIGGAWRALKAALPVGLKEQLKALIRPRRGTRTASGAGAARPRAGAPSAGTGRASPRTQPAAEVADPDAWPSEAALIEGLNDYLERVERSDAENLVFFVAGVKFVESEGQRVTQIVRELVRHGTPALLTYFRWQNEYGQSVPRPHDPRFFQIPMDIFARHRQCLLAWRPRRNLTRTCVFEFPHPSAFQWVNEFNLAGWNTVYDIIDDWEEFHAAGKAVWYEPAVEQYLCANCNAVTAIVPLLAEKARQWVPGLEVEIVPNGVSPDSFDMSTPRRPLERGEITVGYFGYLARAWFDWELVAQVAARRPTWRFYIIGYGEPPAVRLPQNVQLLGKVPHHELPGYSQNWDVGIVPFRPGALSRAADPIKVYEYLALGLPVVATDIPHLHAYPGVHVATSAAEFESLLEKAAREGLNRPVVGEFVRKSTWHQRGLALIDAGRRGRQNRRLPQTLLCGSAS